ncbi:hypothetical protein BJF83_20255 [Nocardiopsis sp. CNR-923]|nr:hypothetical protein BJF83_20255 [Nocardiopsis sp. CNR-923]
MSMGRDPRSGGWMIAPVAHGAPFEPDIDGAVVAPEGVSVHVAALARFGQMALLGLDRLPARTDLDNAVVVGSGPVALGCVLELRRRGVRQVRVLTRRAAPPIGHAPGAECVDRLPPGSGLVIDAVGDPGPIADALSPGSVLGLLGTPEADVVLPAAVMHRGGWTVVGMHELAPMRTGSYQTAYHTVAAHLAETLPPDLIRVWCRTVPGERAPNVHALLAGRGRPQEPVIVFAWAP